MQSGCHVGETDRTSRHPGRGSPLHELTEFAEDCIFSINRPPPTRYPALLTVVPQVTWSMQNKGLLHYNFWLGNSFSNKIWKSIEKNLHRSIKGRDIKKENVGSPLSFSLEAKFQLEEIALEQLNGSVRASPRQQAGFHFLRACLYLST